MAYKTYAKSAIDGRVIRPKLYRVWSAMKGRCYCENDQRYNSYGRRGIRVCEAWHSFAAFRAWAVSAGYRKGLSIDRIDNDGNYEPDNCRWIPLEMNRATRLTPRMVREIRASNLNDSVLGRKYGCHPTHIARVKSGEKWSHIK